VLEADGVTVRFGERAVLDAIDLHVGPGERVGIVGPNGAGKTTLLKALTGELEPDAGTITWGSTVVLASYAQEVTAEPVERKVIDTITAIAEWIPLANGERVAAGRLAERFGFDTRLQQASVAQLSGGERRRLALLHVLVQAPNVLILDEPTNDLDIDTLQALEDHLDGFRGTLIVATHDRYVLDRLTDRLLAVEGGRLVPYLDWDAYRQAHAAGWAGSESRPSDTAADNRRRQERRRELRSIEQRIARLEAERDDVDRELAAVGADYGRADELSRRRRRVAEDLAGLEDRWLELTVDDADTGT
jgi:ATP-binding cassette subfamily F protein uup